MLLCFRFNPYLAIYDITNYSTNNYYCYKINRKE